MRALALACSVLMTGGCSIVDQTLPPRAYDINQGTQNARESAILLNVVRASRSEPLNFVALSKYTGSGGAGTSDSLLKNDILRFGNPSNVIIGRAVAGAVTANASNSFDVGTLENRDFYGGLLAPLDLEALNLLLNAGLTREIVFHSVIQAFRVTVDGHAFLYENNPEDDAIIAGDPWSRECSARYGTDEDLEPVAGKPIWLNPGACKYQKFLYFLRLAVRWGATVSAIPLSGRPHAGSRKSSKSDRDRDREEDRPRAHFFVCYDPAIAQENRMKGASVNSPGACGSAFRDLRQTREFQFRFRFDTPVKGVVPIIRSPYAVFRFYGELLAREENFRVRLSKYSLDKDRHREARLFTITKGGTDCFARVSYGGEYCVPNNNTKNTKEVFVLLNTLVALSTNRSALPVTPTFILSQ
jgi:hypothetical protein